MYYSHKEYGHERGLSCCFRQHAADSHCNLLHGYALSVKLEFSAEELDERNWVIDFGGLKRVETYLKDTFDHKLLLSEDDPIILNGSRAIGEDDSTLDHLLTIADVIVVRRVGCEAFAEMIYHFVSAWLFDTHGSRVKLDRVTVKEHGANGASYGN